MAKRKRLTPANPAFLDPAPETKSAFSMHAAPIADVAREASATAAVEEMAASLRAAREEGRMVIPVPLDDVHMEYLVRDRVVVDAEEQEALVESLSRRGQQTPVELVDLGEGAQPRYGLISGWRRVMALKALRARGEEVQEVLGLLRRPAESSQAYLAMIEENEIRVGLSYYERARIALKAVEAGAFPVVSEALNTLYANASRAKRSKIRSFMTLVEKLDGALAFPGAIGERLGLQMAQALEADVALAERLRVRLGVAKPGSVEAEQSLLRQEIAPSKPAPKTKSASKSASTESPATPAQPASARGPIHLRSHGAHQIVLEGRGVDAAFREELAAWLAARQR